VVLGDVDNIPVEWLRNENCASAFFPFTVSPLLTQMLGSDECALCHVVVRRRFMCICIHFVVKIVVSVTDNFFCFRNIVKIMFEQVDRSVHGRIACGVLRGGVWCTVCLNKLITRQNATRIRGHTTVSN
jgi:hypothetical protein